MIKYHLSDYAKKSLIPSAVNEMTESFAVDFREGVDINLGVGYVNDKTIPAVAISDALHTVLADPEKYRNALNYGGAEGAPNLVQAIKDYYIRNSVGGFSADDFDDKAVVIGANGATSILESLAHLFTPGVVITTEPCYYIYTEFLERLGYTVIGIPELEDGIDIDVLQDRLAQIPVDSLRFMYMITVNNPTGTILSNKKRHQLVEIAEELSEKIGRTIPVVFDRAYEDIIHNESFEKPQSPLLNDANGLVIEVGTLSKILAPALRIGYLIARKSSLTQALIQRVSDIGFSAPLVNQEIASVLLNQHLDEQLDAVRRGYRKKADFLKGLFDKQFGEHIQTLKGGDAGFYFYIQFLSIETGKSSRFYRYLSRTTGDPVVDGVKEKSPRLVYIPGEICTVPNSAIADDARYSLRLSFGFEETPVLEKAVSLIKEAIDYSLAK